MYIYMRPLCDQKQKQQTNFPKLKLFQVHVPSSQIFSMLESSGIQT